MFEQGGHVMDNSVSSKALQTTETYKTTNLVGTESYVWTLESAEGGGYYLKNVSLATNSYLNNASSKTDMSFGAASSKWTFSFTNGIALIQNSSNSDRYLGYTNSTSYAYKAYATSNMDYSHAIRVYKLVEAPSCTITAVSSNDTYGTVSSVGNVITGSPKSGCRYASPAYTVVSGSATVAQEGNTFTVTTSVDCTIRINFEEIPSHTLAYAVSPVAAGNVTLSATSVKEGATATATAAANAGYKFTGWTITGTGASLSSTSTNPTTLTMGTADATVTALFEAVVTHEIKWSVNGTIIKTENVEENTDLDFSEPTSGIPSGYTFKGWVVEANKINTPTDTDPSASYVTSGKSTEDITYYAVMAQLKTASSETTITLKNKTIQDNASGKSSYSNVYNIENWTGRYLINNNSGNYTLQLGYNTDSSKSAYNSHLTTPSASENIQSITIEANQAVTFYLCSATNLGTAAVDNATYGYGSTTNSNKTITINVSGDTKQLHIYPSGTANIKSISMTYGTPAVYKNYCCTVPDINVTVSSVSYATFSDDVARDFSESGIKVYTAKATTSTVSFTEVNDGIVPANVGVVLYKDGGTTGSVAIPAVETAKTSLSENEMVANVERTKVSATGEGGKTNYILSNETAGVGFYKAATGDGAYLAAHRAYLSTGAAASRSFLGFDDETTGIESIDVSTENTNVAREYYNLNGQRVTTPTKGLYIVNGKKVIINK